MSRRRKPYFWRDVAFTALVILSMCVLLAIAFDIYPAAGPNPSLVTAE